MEIEGHSHAKYIIAIVLLAVIMVASLWGLVDRTNRMSEVENALTATQSQLSSALAEAETAQNQLIKTTTELTQTRSELTTAQNKLTSTQNELQITSANLTATLDKLTETELDYAAARQQLTIEMEQSDTLQEEIDALQVNYDRMTTGYGYALKDPTYRVMKSFLAADRTDSYTYDINSYVCEDFSADVKANAMKQNIRCAYVSIRFPGNTGGHAIIAFNTTDKGIIYIEPQSDEEVRLQVGKRYYQCVIPNPGTYYEVPDYNDTIERFNVIW
jgi:type II secretory pathway pseudopilin PulG